MSTQSKVGGPKSAKSANSGSFTFRPPAIARSLAVAIAAVAALSISVPAVKADTAGQAEIAKFLPVGKTVVTASSKDLLIAVSDALVDGSNPDSPAALVASALQPIAGHVRSSTVGNNNTEAPLLAGTAVGVILSNTSSTLASDGTNIAAITDALLDVNEPTTSQELSAGARASTLKKVLGVVSNASGGTLPVLVADKDIGTALATDSYLEGLPGNALITLLQGGITGVTGVTGTAQAIAPEAASQFVDGIVTSGSLPDGLPYYTFAVDIIKPIASNTSADELVASAIGLEFSSQGQLITTATSLYAKYTSAAQVTKITQGLTSVIPKGNNTEVNRASLVQALVTDSVKNVVAIDEGATYVDPYYSSAFTQSSFASLTGSGGATLANKYATPIASGIGAVLGQDGNELTQVASVFSALTGSNTLNPANAAAEANALINGAVKSTVPASQFNDQATGGGGGKLVVGTAITGNTATDLASILDLFAGGILTGNGTATPAELTKDENEIAALAKNVANFTGNENVTISVPNQAASEPVGLYLAGTLGDYIAGLSLGSAVNADLFAAIVKGVNGAASVTKSAIHTDVKDLFVSNSSDPYTNYPSVGAIAVQETTVTNL